MTLIVSLRIPDGIVIAGDSLSTMMAQIQIQGKFDVTCPGCGHQHQIGPLPINLNVPSTTFSFAQKVFPFMKKYGVGTYGQGQLMGKTMYFAIRELEPQIEGHELAGVTEAAEKIGEYMTDLLRAEVDNLDDAPDDWFPVGFQVVGYDGSKAKTIQLRIGKTIETLTHDSHGCTYTGQGRVVDAIWQLYKKHPEDKAAYPSFSLQDAIAYAEFLIGTTASYQRFSRSISQVGGEIDIGLVTPFDGFKWIRQKPLGRILGGDQ